MRSLVVMGYQVFSDDLSTIDWKNGKTVINTLNAHSWVVAEKDARFKQALQSSDILLPDGSGIVLAARQLGGNRIRKIAGADLHHHLLQRLDAEGGSCFYMGSSKETLEKIRARLGKEYPNIRAGFHSPPFKSEFSDTENREIIAAVNALRPDVLFVGMTAPKQEKWVQEHKEALEAGAICSIGAVFDFYAGNVRRAPQWMLDLHLEWLHRSMTSWRLMKRTLVSSPLFLLAVYARKFGLKR